MEKILEEIIAWFINTLLIDFVMKPTLGNINNLMDSDYIYTVLHVDTFFPIMRSVGMGIFVLVITWQAFKSIFSFGGVEAEDPAKIAFKAIAIGFLLFYSKDILMMFSTYTSEIISGILDINSTFAEFKDDYLTANSAFREKMFSGFGVVTGGDNSSPLLSELIVIYVLFKLIGIFIRMIERIVLNGFLIIGAPLAFATGVSQPTKGFLQGFIKVFVGNLVVMVLQNLGVAVIFQFILDPTNGISKSLVAAFVGIALVKVIAKLEDIVRDMSVGVGVGRDMGGALQTIQSAAYSGPMVVNAVKTIRGG